MNQPALLFNPSIAPTDELEAVFVARRPILDSIVEILRQQTKGKTTQHVLLIGPRGSGKTHLTEILARRMTSASPPWRVVRLPEESYSFVGLDELLFSIVSRDAGKDAAWGTAVPPIDASLAALELQTKASKRPLLVIIENLPRVLTKVLRGEQEVRRLRSILMADPPFTLVATATSYFEDITREARPFYDFFRIFTLQDLIADEVEELVTKRAQWDRDPVVLEQIDALNKRIRAIHHLSGGNPRLVLALYDILARGVSQDIHRQFIALLDRVTPYYQSRIEDLSTQQAQVLVRLAIAPGAVSASTLARACHRPTSHITAVLDVLLAERFVQRIPSKQGARTRYAVSDRLFRIWLEMRENRGARGKLRFLVEFYQMAYTRKELELAIVHWGNEFSKMIRSSWSSGCEDHALMIDYLSEALKLSSETQKDRLFDILSRDDSDFTSTVEQLRRAARETKVDHPAIASALHLALAQRLYYMRRPRDVIIEIDAAEELVAGDAKTGYLRALALLAQLKFKESITASLAALRSDDHPDHAIVQMHTLMMAASHYLLNDLGAKEQFIEALHMDSCTHCVALRCEVLVAELPGAKKFRSRVEALIEMVMEVVGEHPPILHALTLRAIRETNYELARKYARRVTILQPGSISAWVKLACTESNLASLEGFVEAFKQAAPRAVGHDRSHLLSDVADALRRCAAPSVEGEELVTLLREMKLDEQDLSSLYRGLWKTLGPDISIEWAADVISLFEALGAEPQEPWHSFMEFVRDQRSPDFLEFLHPEIGEAVSVLMKEIRGESTSATFDTLQPGAKRRSSRRRASRADVTRSRP